MKKFIAILVAAIMVLSMAGCNTQPKMGAGDKVIATSGAEKMYLRDYLYTLGSYKAQNEYYIGQMMELSQEDFAEYWNGESYVTEGAAMFDDLKDTALQSAFEMANLYKIAKDNGFKPDDAEMKSVKESLDQTVVQLNSQDKTGERFFYEYYYVTKEEALEVSKMISVVEQYENSVRDSIEVSDDEVKAFYDDEANKAQIDNIQKATVAHVLIEVPEGTEEAAKEAYKAQADDILARAQSGENFGELAAEFSADGGSKDNNGEYTITRNEQFVPEFLEWTFAAEVGEFGIVETSYGYHVMHLVSLEGYEEMKESIRDLVTNQRYSEEIDNVLAESALEWEVDEEMLASIKYDVYGKDFVPATEQ